VVIFVQQHAFVFFFSFFFFLQKEVIQFVSKPWFISIFTCWLHVVLVSHLLTKSISPRHALHWVYLSFILFIHLFVQF
jgi:hypothetical protein